MSDVIRRQPIIDAEQDGETLEKVEGHIELQHVTFTYPARPELPIFTDFNLVVSAGEMVALQAALLNCWLP